MTSGTKSLNTQQIIGAPWNTPNDNCGHGVNTCTVGTKWTVSWSGADQPQKTGKQPQVLHKYSYNLFDARGKVIGVRTRKVPFPRSRYKQDWGEHSYFKSVAIATDAPEKRVQSCNHQYDYVTYADSSGRPNYGASADVGWTSNDDIALSGRLRAKLGAQFDLTIFLGEGHEALSTIAHTATRIYLSLKKVKRGDLIGATKVLLQNSNSHGKPYLRNLSKKDASGRYLEWTYAVKPLLEDVSNAAEHLAYMQNRPKVQVYRTSKKSNWSGRLPIGTGGPYSPVTRCIRKSIVAKVTHVNEAALIGLTNPAAVAWEVMPWSFVADWFIPIGNYLQALNLSNSLSGTFITSTRDEAFCYGYYSTGSLTIVDAPFYRYNLSFQRTVGSSLARPELPGVKPLAKAASFKHCVNAVALLVSRFASK